MYDPIAITGYGIRFPGGIFDEKTFWEFITSKQYSTGEIPSDRWDVNRFYDENPDIPGKMYVKHGNFLQAPISEFDALHFGVTPREADCMDPQQRLLLTVVWEALHHAGVVPESLAGSKTGVYIGAFTLDNLIHQMGPQARELINAHTAVGSTMTILSNRISYLLDLRGPSLTVDTACSSSLVALHLACQSIWSGQCERALVGGVNVMFRPEYFVAMCKGKFLAKDGRCKTFDERADGYGRGEGAGVMVLKPLSQAQRDGDVIHGLIAATGVNQDGRSNGITSPNRESQIDLIREVHQSIQLDPNQLSFVEAHGTGTQAGDTAETHALGEAIGKLRSAPLPVGSVKANLGHLEAASGIAGVLKTLLCLKHKQVTAIAGLENPNPTIPFADLGLHLPRENETFAAGKDKTFAAVNSFGYGGTNAHVVLQAADDVVAEVTSKKSPQQNYFLLPLSAKDPLALEEMAQRYAQFIASQSANDLANICYSAACHRSHYAHRAVFAGQDQQELLTQLQSFGEVKQGDLISSAEFSGDAQNPVWVFTGMGPQWWAMGRELYANDEVFQQEVDRCAVAFEKVSGWSILAELLADENDSRMAETIIAQPANFLLQAGLAAMWSARGIQPAAIIGHSVGEVSSAYIAGVLTVEEAALVSFHRSRVQSKAAGQGGMLAIGLTEDDARRLLRRYSYGKVDIAAVNSPTSVTLAGDKIVLKSIAAELEAKGEFNRELQVEVPYHSPYMDPLMPELREILSVLKPQLPTIPLYSTVTGKLVEGIAYDADYWVKNCRNAVLFSAAITQLLRDNHSVFLEIGPHPVLSPSIKQCAVEVGKNVNVVTSLVRKKSELQTFNVATAELHNAGCDIDWQAIFSEQCHYTPLPAYPWQVSHYWLEGKSSSTDRISVVSHPLLGLANEGPQSLWTNALGSELHPYLNDHCVEDLVVLPGAAYVELGLAAHHQQFAMSQWSLQNLAFFNALIVGENESPQIQTVLDANNKGFSIFSRADSNAQWKSHAKGEFSLLPLGYRESLDLGALRAKMSKQQSHEQHYNNMTQRKLQYGECFQGVTQVWQSDAAILANISAPAKVARELSQYYLHPALLDACFQSLLSILSPTDRRAYVPTQIRRLNFYGALPQEFCCYGEIQHLSDELLVGKLTLCTTTGDVLAELDGIRAQALSNKTQLTEQDLDSWLYQYAWHKAEALEATVDVEKSSATGPWLFIGDTNNNNSVAQRLQSALLDSGQHTITACYANQFAQITPTSFEIRNGSSDDMLQLAKSVGEIALAGVIVIPREENCGNPVSTAKVQTLLAVIQGIARAETSNISELVCITRSAQVVSDENINLEETGLVALLKVAANEYPAINFRSIDVESCDSINSLQDNVVAEICSKSDEHEVAYRAGERYALRLEKITAKGMQTICDENAQIAERFTIDVNENGVTLKELIAPQLTASDITLEAQESSLLTKEFYPVNTPAHSDFGLSLRLHFGRVVIQRSDAVLSSDNSPSNSLLSSNSSGSNSSIVNSSSSDSSSNKLSGSNLSGSKLLGKRGYMLGGPELASHINGSVQQTLLTSALSSAISLDPSVHDVTRVFAYVIAQRMLDFSQATAGQRILIHAADSAIGAAAVHLATNRQLQVYATADNVESIPDSIRAVITQIFSSSDLDFSMWLQQDGELDLIDVVLNPFDGEIANHSLALVKPGGCFLHFGDDGLMARKGVTLQMLNLDHLLLESPEAFRSALQYSLELLAETASQTGLKQATNSNSYFTLETLHEHQLAEFSRVDNNVDNKVGNKVENEAANEEDNYDLANAEDVTLAGKDVPAAILPSTILPAATLSKTAASPTRSLTASLHITKPQSPSLFAANSISIRDDATYLVTGGFGGFGQGVINDLVARGCRHVVIVSRSGAKTDSDKALVKSLTALNVNVVVAQLDIANADQVSALFATQLASMPPLRGIAHTAGILDDSPINFVTPEQLDSVMGPKVQGAWNLHQQTLDQPLDFFLLFSSISSMIGAAGQATYVIANTWLDTFASYRRRLGLSATSVCWGALDEVGMAAIDPEVVAYFERVGLKPMPPQKVFGTFEHIVNWRTANIGLVDMNWGAWASYYPNWGKSPRYAHLVPAQDGSNMQSADWIRSWANLSLDDQTQEILQRLIKVIATAMKLPADKIGGSDSLTMLGIDSLIAMELQNNIQQELQVRLSTLELMKGNSLKQMAEQIGAKYHEQLGETDSPQDSSDELAALDESELDQLLESLTE